MAPATGKNVLTHFILVVPNNKDLFFLIGHFYLLKNADTILSALFGENSVPG